MSIQTLDDIAICIIGVIFICVVLWVLWETRSAGGSYIHMHPALMDQEIRNARAFAMVERAGIEHKYRSEMTPREQQWMEEILDYTMYGTKLPEQIKGSPVVKREENILHVRFKGTE